MTDVPPSVEVEFIDDEVPPVPRSAPAASNQTSKLVGLLFVGIVALLIGWSVLVDFGSSGQPVPANAKRELPSTASISPADRPDAQLDAARVTQSIPRPLLAAELFVADPGPAELRSLLDAVGGFEGVTLASSVGAFDLVRFDPLDPDRLLATNRSSYGNAENQSANELWRITDERVEQALWAPSTSHDFVHFNADGTVTMWVDTEGPGFDPRIAQVLDGGFSPIASAGPMYASRFTVDDKKVFALTGNGDYYSTEPGYVSLIADDSGTRTVLAGGSAYGWIDNPTPGLLVAYPLTAAGPTAVWDTETLQPIEGHPLAGRSYQRLAVSGDGSVAVGITFDDVLEEIDLQSGRVTSRFGSIDPTGIDQPVTLNNDGTIAITVDRGGRLTIWWVGENEPIAEASADAGQPRWIPDRFGARFASAVAADASRVALRIGAVGQVSTHWAIIETDIDSWIGFACNLAGRPLTQDERLALGLPSEPSACA